MADPTPQQVLTGAQLSGGRTVSIWDELQRILRVVLPEVIDQANEDFTLAIPKPQRVILKGEKMPSKNPFLAIETSKNYQPFGLGGAYLGKVSLKIHVCTSSHDSAVGLRDTSDLAELIVPLITQYEGHRCTADGRAAWTQIYPGVITDLEGEDFKSYIGKTIHYTLDQAPAEDGWTPTP